MGLFTLGLQVILQKRVWEHKWILLADSRSDMECINLSIWSCHDDILSAIAREKQLKKWNRAWKLELIEAQNPDWKDLSG